MASVLAHEITHVTQRHLARSLEAQEKASPATIAGLLGAILLTIAAPQAGMAALATTQALSTQSKINYTRLHEKEADRIGMQILVESGFDPNASANFFGKLAARYRFTSKPPQMLLTHPLPESRITDAVIARLSIPTDMWQTTLTSTWPRPGSRCAFPATATMLHCRCLKPS